MTLAKRLKAAYFYPSLALSNCAYSKGKPSRILTAPDIDGKATAFASENAKPFFHLDECKSVEVCGLGYALAHREGKSKP